MEHQSPIIYEQEKAEELAGICTDMLKNARNELYLNMRFMDIALSSLFFKPDFGAVGIGTDGFLLTYQPEYLAQLYRKNRVYVNRTYLHSILHCVFLHMDTRGGRRPDMFNLACDIAVESMIDGLYLKCLHRPMPPVRREFYQRAAGRVKVMNAQSIYRFLEEENLPEGRYLSLAAEFYGDEHSYWDGDKDKPQMSTERKNKWDGVRERMETEMQTFSKKASDEAKGLFEQVKIENRERYSYRDFLRKFSVFREVMQIDMDAFDYIYYNYGMATYGNMPLIEPLETKEIKRIEEFAIVIDTSMSVSGELVTRFLEETYSVLSEAENFFTKVNIHVIQCDERVQQDQLITCPEELTAYMDNLEIRGQGGTDFRPAFQYVDSLIQKKVFQRLKGLIYFTDGYGMFPLKRPAYETAFVFMRDDYSDADVPPWAIKLILDAEDLSQRRMKT